MATRRWLGVAANKTHVVTVTIANTWATGDTITLTIANVDFVVTIGANVTTAQVATTLKEAFNGDTLTDTTASFTPNGSSGAQDIGFFAEIEASVSGSVVTFTARESGVPFTMTATESTAGSGTATLATSVPATGRNFFSDQDNWSGNTVPVDGDDIVFDSGDIDVLHGLSPAIQPGSVTITRGYTGRIGLPDINPGPSGTSGDLKFYEYRTRRLTFDNNATTCTYTIGQREGQGSGMIRIDAGAGRSTVNVWSTGQNRYDQGLPAFEFIGTHASNAMYVMDGDACAAFQKGDSTTLSILQVGSDSTSNARMVVGDDATLTTVVQSGGSLTLSASCTTLTMHGGEATQLAGSPATLAINAGEYIDRSTATIGTGLTVGSRGHYNRTQDNRAKTITPQVTLYSGSKFHDPNKTLTLTGGFTTVGCGIENCEISLGIGRSYTAT